ncbi:MAG: gspF, partial [Deltaproteobacteria bacterium]|nr:gspF [Deltaproteobacteria bacterium]
IRILPAREKGEGARVFDFLPQRVGIKHLLLFTQELSTLVSAGLPLDRSLSILRSLTENRKLREVIGDILSRIEGGSSLAEALSQHPRIFSRLYVNMIKAGESGGFLDVILSRLAKYLQTMKETQDYLITVLIYPVILTLITGASITIMITFVIPRFAKIFADMGQTIPLPTQIVLALSQGFREYWWIGVVIGILIYLGIRGYKREEDRRYRWDQFKLSWIGVGSLIRKIEVARFARTLGTLLQSGVPILPALNLVKDISQNLAITRAIAHVHDRLREGKSGAKSLEETGVFPALAVQMIGVGEETGKLEEMLIRVAESYEENVQNTIKRLVSFLEPIIIVVMGLVVGFIVLSILLAIISINEIPF